MDWFSWKLDDISSLLLLLLLLFNVGDGHSDFFDKNDELFCWDDKSAESDKEIYYLLINDTYIKFIQQDIY